MDSFKGGFGLIRKSLFSYMASRAFFWTLSIGWLMGPLVYLFVWVTAAGQGAPGGFSRHDFVLYYLVLILVNQLTYPSSHWIIGESIQAGKLSSWLLRPLPVICEGIASDIALKMVCMPFVLALMVLLGLVLGMQASITLTGLLLFMAALLLAQVLRFLLAYSMALLAFWTQKIESLLSVNDTLVFLLAGQVAPIALLPGVMKSLAVALPYRYMMGFPVELLLGKLKPEEILIGFTIQLGWTLAAFLASRVIWRIGIRHYTAVGG